MPSFLSIRRGAAAAAHALFASALVAVALLASLLVLSVLLARPVSAQGWIEPLPGRPIPLGTWAVEKTRSEVPSVKQKSRKGQHRMQQPTQDGDSAAVLNQNFVRWIGAVN